MSYERMMTDNEFIVSLHRMWVEGYTANLKKMESKTISLEENCQGILALIETLEPNTFETLNFLTSSMNHIFRRVCPAQFKTKKEFHTTLHTMYGLSRFTRIDDGYLAYLKHKKLNVLYTIMSIEKLIRKTKLAIKSKK